MTDRKLTQGTAIPSIATADKFYIVPNAGTVPWGYVTSQVMAGYISAGAGTALYPTGAFVTGGYLYFNGGTVLTDSVANLATSLGSYFQAYDAQLSSLIRQNSQSAAYTTVLTDGGKHILHPAADTTARTFTIDSNANVAYPIGTVITFVNENGAGVVTIAITSDTMRLAGAGTTGSRTLAANGIATALKITSTSWIISGTGLT